MSKNCAVETFMKEYRELKFKTGGSPDFINSDDYDEYLKRLEELVQLHKQPNSNIYLQTFQE